MKIYNCSVKLIFLLWYYKKTQQSLFNFTTFLLLFLESSVNMSTTVTTRDEEDSY